jgi:hypothetical protein
MNALLPMLMAAALNCFGGEKYPRRITCLPRRKRRRVIPFLEELESRNLLTGNPANASG